MKLSDKTTVKTLREMIGKKIKTRTSKALVEITDIELSADQTWFIGYEGSRKRRIKLEWIAELVEPDNEDDTKDPKKRSKTPDELSEERLRKAEEAEKKLRPDEKKSRDYSADTDEPSIYTL